MLFTLKLFIWFSCHWILLEEYIYMYIYIYIYLFIYLFFWFTRIGFLATIPHFGLLSGNYGKRLFQPWFMLIVHWKYYQLKLRQLVCIFCNKWHVLHQVTYRIPSWHLKVTTIPWFDDLKFLRLWKWARFTNTTSLFFFIFRDLSCSRDGTISSSYHEKEIIDSSGSLVCGCWSVLVCRLWSICHNARHKRRKFVLIILFIMTDSDVSFPWH